MTSREPHINPSDLYQLKEAAAILGVAQSTLHRYEKEGICKASIRRTNGRRVWKGSELIRCWRTIY